MKAITDFFTAWWSAWMSLFAGQFQIDSAGYILATLPLVFAIGIVVKVIVKAIVLVCYAGRFLFKK